ncbi:hypothetical protein ACFPDQ_01225 [Pseudofrancisella aestuarii]|uniref:Lipoprotein n=1 Tax=Pseudofrancisella aestuarii TaxID=2670347 RepID=A0ABV9T9U1_9GAMM|nr:hypothetical protein [Pseudofrancisella aestuarii]
MKLKSIFSVVSTILLSVLLISCAQTVSNLNDQPIPADFTQEQVKSAIIDGGKNRGWIIIQSDKPNQLIGRLLYKGKYSVTVDIPYSEKGYSIEYADSVGLDYDKVENKIDRHYNNWVILLNQDIQRKLLIEEAKVKNS